MVGLENPLHIAIVLVVVLMVFGAKRLPEMGKGLGEGMRGFKSALSGEEPAPQISLTSTEPTARPAAEAPAPHGEPVREAQRQTRPAA